MFFALPVASPPGGHDIAAYDRYSRYSSCLSLGAVCLPLFALPLLSVIFFGVFVPRNIYSEVPGL